MFRVLSFYMVFNVRKCLILLIFKVRRRKFIERNRIVLVVLKVLIYSIFVKNSMFFNVINSL